MATESLQDFRQRAFNCLYDAGLQVVDRTNRHIDELNFPGTPARASRSYYQTFHDLLAIAGRFRADRGCRDTPAEKDVMEFASKLLPQIQHLWQYSRMNGVERLFSPQASPQIFAEEVGAFSINVTFHSAIALYSGHRGQQVARTQLLRGQIPGQSFSQAALHLGIGRLIMFEALALALGIPYLIQSDPLKIPHLYYSRPKELQLSTNELFPPETPQPKAP